MLSTHETPKAAIQPTKIEPLSDYLMFIEWNSKEKFAVPYFQIRYHCPCAVCVDEHTGKRVLKEEDLDPLVKPKGVRLVGRYAVQIDWSDQHSTGMYHFSTLYEISKGLGKLIPS